MTHNDIAILACYPRNLIYCHTLYHLIKQNFKHIFFIYSDVDNFNHKTKYHKHLLRHERVDVVRVDNIGYDFYKYYRGFQIIKERGLTYERIWCLNDSFYIGDWQYFMRHYHYASGDIIGCYTSYHIKTHLQSFFLIMNEKVVQYYVDFFQTYPFFVAIDTDRKKNKIILELEINLNHDIITKDDIQYDSVFKQHRYNEDCIHPGVYYGFNNHIFKSNAFTFCERYNMTSPFIHQYIANRHNIRDKILFGFLTSGGIKKQLDRTGNAEQKQELLAINHLLSQHTLRFFKMSFFLNYCLRQFSHKLLKHHFIHFFICNFKDIIIKT